MPRQECVPDERADIEKEVRDHKRRHASPAGVEPAEEHSHGEIAKEAAQALVEVVAGPQGGGEPDRNRPGEAQLAKADEHVADDDQFLEQGVLRC